MPALLAPMAGSNSSRKRQHGSPRRRTSRGLALLAWAVATPALAAQTVKPDHVVWRNARGQTNTVMGTITENSLTQVVVDTGSTQRKLGALDVESVDFGAVPPAYQEAQAYFERNDFENAAAKFSLAAADASARDVVRARARLHAAEARLRSGANDPAAFESARKECEQFLADHASNRDVPRARLLLGRLQRLAGGASQAAETYVALYREASQAQATAGYPPEISFQAGLHAAEAYLAAKNAPQARELYLGLDAALGAALAQLAEGDALRLRLGAIQSEARLGEGYCLLASGSLSQAKTFFQGQITGSEGNAARRFGAQLGLAEALLAEGSVRAAQIEFAQVSALDHTDEDRIGRALVGLAECALKLANAGARNDARVWLESVRDQYGATPAVLRAQELLKTL